jgi:hypothetical protein
MSTAPPASGGARARSVAAEANHALMYMSCCSDQTRARRHGDIAAGGVATGYRAMPWADAVFEPQ